ncbi:MAG: glycosyltransferase family 4 protein, partial [Oscillospiraceae bacterium]|nr:glycosyltransferase family 4 protein [Oscillospiraceae bacterium]
FRLSVSNKLFEYASAGIPVIMSDIPEHRYLNDKYHFGIILPENTPKAFAEAVIRLYTDRSLYDNCVEGARKLTREVNWETEFARLIAVERSWMDGTQ